MWISANIYFQLFWQNSNSELILNWTVLPKRIENCSKKEEWKERQPEKAALGWE